MVCGAGGACAGQAEPDVLAPPYKPQRSKKRRGPQGGQGGAVEDRYEAEMQAMLGGWVEDDWALAMRELDRLEEVAERDGLLAQLSGRAVP